MKPLNWRELAALVQAQHAELVGRFVDRVFVPTSAARSETPERFLRSEWALRLSARGRPEVDWCFSVRPGAPWIVLAPEKKLKPAPGATQSPFSLALMARLAGAKVLDIQAFDQERSVAVRFSAPAQKNLILVLTLIPATTEAFLFECPEGAALSPDQTYPLIARSRSNRPLEWKLQASRTSTASTSAIAAMTITDDSVYRWQEHFTKHEAALLDAALADRAALVERHLTAQIKTLRTRITQAQNQEQIARDEPPWSTYGDRLKTEWAIQMASTTSWSERLKAPDFQIPIDPEFLGDRFAGGFDAKAQLERYFSRARRGRARLAEASTRKHDLGESLQAAERKLAELTTGHLGRLDWKTLRSIEASLGLRSEAPATPGAKRPAAHASWSGKVVLSKEGLLIRAGRNKTENLELTFKIARGNDIWMHLRGKPGAHVVITVPPGKSASLDTLLDAAHLCIHYSGGADWGKAEVDYTARKYVKRIKDSDEASYTQNKTLMIAIDRERLKRLLAP